MDQEDLQVRGDGPGDPTEETEVVVDPSLADEEEADSGRSSSPLIDVVDLSPGGAGEEPATGTGGEAAQAAVHAHKCFVRPWERNGVQRHKISPQDQQIPAMAPLMSSTPRMTRQGLPSGPGPLDLSLGLPQNSPVPQFPRSSMQTPAPFGTSPGFFGKPGQSPYGYGGLFGSSVLGFNSSSLDSSGLGPSTTSIPGLSQPGSFDVRPSSFSSFHSSGLGSSLNYSSPAYSDLNGYVNGVPMNDSLLMTNNLGSPAQSQLPAYSQLSTTNSYSSLDSGYRSLNASIGNSPAPTFPPFFTTPTGVKNIPAATAGYRRDVRSLTELRMQQRREQRQQRLTQAADNNSTSDVRSMENVPSTSTESAQALDTKITSPLNNNTSRVSETNEHANSNNKEDQSPTNGSNRKTISRHAKNILKRWYDQHLRHPYPNKEETTELAHAADITETQVKKWYANKRVRTNNTLTYNGAIHPRRLERLEREFADDPGRLAALTLEQQLRQRTAQTFNRLNSYWPLPPGPPQLHQ